MRGFASSFTDRTISAITTSTESRRNVKAALTRNGNPRKVGSDTLLRVAAARTIDAAREAESLLPRGSSESCGIALARPAARPTGPPVSRAAGRASGEPDPASFGVSEVSGLARTIDALLPPRPKRSNASPPTGALPLPTIETVLSVASGTMTATVSRLFSNGVIITDPASESQPVFMAGAPGNTGARARAESELERLRSLHA